MKVLLIDVDSTIPNLALMKISAWHKSRKDMVGFDIRDPDKVYISCVFSTSKSKQEVKGIATFYEDAEIDIGGSGIDLKKTLPPHIEYLKPDYDLYPSSYSQGFTSRGCPRICEPCIVNIKEGKFKIAQHIKEFHDDRFDTVMLMDNNILADRWWFFENTNWIIQKGLKVIEHGMDIRFLTPQIADQLKRIKFIPTLHFAWGSLDMQEDVEKGIKILKEAGLNLRRGIQFYVLVGNRGTTFEDALYRCERLKKLGTNAYVMRYNTQRDPHLNKLARWANFKNIFWKYDFKEYTRKRIPAS